MAIKYELLEDCKYGLKGQVITAAAPSRIADLNHGMGKIYVESEPKPVSKSEPKPVPKPVSKPVSKSEPKPVPKPKPVQRRSSKGKFVSKKKK